MNKETTDLTEISFKKLSDLKMGEWDSHFTTLETFQECIQVK